MTNIYIHIGVIGAVNKILNGLLSRIDDSGLYDFCDKVYLVSNGDKNQLQFEFKDKYKLINANYDTTKWEFPTLDIIWKHSQDNNELNILYLHTKGVTKSDYQQITDWTNYLSYFNINMWRDRIGDLEKNDCSGVDLKGNPEDIRYHPVTWGYGKAPLHYSGNFWWSKSDHIKKLPKPSKWMPENNPQKYRMMCEMWLCQIPNGKYSCAWQSNVNHYMENYPEEIYIDRQRKHRSL